jgi:dTDP-4-dehydrorhamnose reductase
MKVLLYGHKGWIGNQLIKILQNNNINIILGTSRVDNKEDVENEITTVKPTHIISTIGRTHGKIGNKVYTTIDFLEQKGKTYENVRDNLFSPMILGLLCKKHNIHLTYLGTGCIFKYDDKHPYAQEINGFTEDSKPNFFDSSYSIVKGFTDELMHMIDANVLNIRIRMPITSCNSSRNFISKISTYEKICSIPNSMTVLDELLPIMVDMAKNKLTGTINLVNPGLISHNEILDMYKEIIDPSFTYKNFTIDEQSKILAAGRSNNYLDTSKLEKLYPNVNNIRDAVRNTLLKMSM